MVSQITDVQESLIDKKIIGIDPGLNDLIYCVDGTDRNANKFRYSQAQRNNGQQCQPDASGGSFRSAVRAAFCKTGDEFVTVAASSNTSTMI